MSAKLRWDDPHCGREGFDGRGGWPLTGSIAHKPDVPWRDYGKQGSEWRWENKQWIVTSFGLEVRSDEWKRRDAFNIPAANLLATEGDLYLWPREAARNPWIDLTLFEEAFRRAIEEHHRAANEAVLSKTFTMAGIQRRIILGRRRT